MAESPFTTVLRHLRQAGCPDTGLTDGQLLARYTASGEEAAFTALLGRHGRLVWGVCRHVLGHDHDAEDAFQATFLVLARKAASIRKSTSVASWLHGVALRVALKVRTRAANRRRRELAVERPPTAPLIGDLALRELQAILDEEVANLPEKLRAPFVLCCLEGKSKAEAAEELRWKEGTVSGRLARAREQLRVRLTRRGVSLSAGLTATAVVGGVASAAVPVSLGETVVAVALGREGVSSSVHTLVREVLRSMLARQLQSLVAVLLVLVASVVGTGWVVRVAFAKDTPPIAGPFVPPPPTPPPLSARREVSDGKLPSGVAVRLGSHHFRHNDMVTAVAWSPDGKTLASAGQDQTVRLWEPATGEERARLLGHTGAVRSLAYSPDGKLLATCSQDKLVCLWDASAVGVGTIKPRQLESHTDSVQAICFTPDGKSLISGGWDGQVIVWDTVSGAVLRRFGDAQYRARCLALSPDGRTLAVAHSQGTPGKASGRVALWDVTRGEEIRQVGPMRPEEVSSLAFSPDGDMIAVGGDRGPSLWEVASGSQLTRLRDVTSSMYTPSVAFSPDGTTLLAGGGGFLRGWKVSTGQPTRTFDVGAVYTYDLAFSPDRKTLAAATTRAVMLWDPDTGKSRQPSTGHFGEVGAVIFTPDGKEVWTGGYDRPIYRWDASSGKQVGQLLGSETWNSAMVLSPDGKTLATFDKNLAIVLRDTASGKERLRFTKHLPPRISGMTPMTVAFTPDSRTVVSCAFGIDPHLRAWETDTGKELWAIDCGGAAAGALAADPARRRGDNLSGVAVSPDGKTIYVGSTQSGIRVCETATGKELRRIGEPGVGVRGDLVLSPDGRRIAGFRSGPSEGVVAWNTETGLPLAHFPRPGGYSLRLTFSPDGRALAITSEAESVRIWEIASGQCRLEWTAHGGPVKCVDFSPDGRLLATGGDDTMGMVWDVRALARTGETADVPADATLWADLGSDAGTAYRIMARLIASPRQGVALLSDRISPVGLAPTAKLIADLDDDDFARREAATEALAALGRVAEDSMRKALVREPSLEARRRLERLLENLGKSEETDRDRVRSLRALEVLETIGSPEARKVLEGLAKGAPEAEATLEAKAALVRLSRRR